MMLPTRAALAATAAVALSVGVFSLWLRRRRSREAEAEGTHASAAPTKLPPPPPQPSVTLVGDSTADSSTAAMEVLRETLSDGYECSFVNLKDLSVDQLRQGGTFLFVLEMDKEGEASAARPLTRALRPLRQTAAGCLDGTTIGVLALAHSVCAFSAASGGDDKYRGGARLQNGLIEMGARLLHKLGTAEVEIEEMGTCVLPWARVIKEALDRVERA